MTNKTEALKAELEKCHKELLFVLKENHTTLDWDNEKQAIVLVHDNTNETVEIPFTGGL